MQSVSEKSFCFKGYYLIGKKIDSYFYYSRHSKEIHLWVNESFISNFKAMDKKTRTTQLISSLSENTKLSNTKFKITTHHRMFDINLLKPYIIKKEITQTIGIGRLYNYHLHHIRYYTKKELQSKEWYDKLINLSEYELVLSTR